MSDVAQKIVELEGYYGKAPAAEVFPSAPSWELLDLSNGPISSVPEYAIGKYAEHRPGQYTSQIYTEERNFHVGLDLIAPAGSEVHCPQDIHFYDKAYLSAEKDYGYCLLGKLVWPGFDVFILIGHLNKKSYDLIDLKKTYKKAQRMGWVGNEKENGGWFPHIHIQLCTVKPDSCDMPGVIVKKELPDWKTIYPDPGIILGPNFRSL